MITNTLKRLGIGFETRFKGKEQEGIWLVMIHGAGGRGTIWLNQLRLPMEGLHSIALDLPGHGETRGRPKTSIHACATWLGQTLETLFDRPVLLMGHSMGGAIAQQTALLYPRLISGLILVGTGARLKVAPVFLKGLVQDFEGTLTTMLAFAYAQGTPAPMVQEGIRLMREAGQDVVHGDFQACDQFDLRDEVGQIQCPCLIICGDQDKLTPPSLSQRLAVSIPDSRLHLIPEAGHMVMIEEPTQVNQAILDFVRDDMRNPQS